MRPPATYTALEALGRVRLSRHFFMRNFLNSEIGNFHGIPNMPEDPDLAIAAGTRLATELLDPLFETFGQVEIRSGYRSPTLNHFGATVVRPQKCSANQKNFAGHIWDRRDAKGRLGACVSVAIPWFADRYAAGRDWRDLAWWVHDHLPYSEMYFFPKLAALNLTWREDPARRILSYIPPKGTLLAAGAEPEEPRARRAARYAGFPPFRGIALPQVEARQACAGGVLSFCKGMQRNAMKLPKTPSFRLDGRRALVTGASRGIGLGAAAALAEAGADVVMAARGRETLQEAVEAVVAAGHSAAALALDVTDTDAVRAAVAEQGPFDILVNSAGLARHAPALETTEDAYDAVMAVNLRAAFFLAQTVARGMVGRGGSIIQISSQMGHVGGVDRAVYAASKHGLEGMTKAMAIEWGGAGIRVNTIGPTFIRTPLTEATFADPDRVAWIEEKIKLGRVGEVEDIMGAVVFLASDASALITGTSLLVDGGWTAG